MLFTFVVGLTKKTAKPRRELKLGEKISRGWLTKLASRLSYWMDSMRELLLVVAGEARVRTILD